MSVAPQPQDPDEALLAELAAMDMAVVRHVHARVLATTDTDEINSLGRTYQRFARSLRQTLALKAKLVRERAQARAQAKAHAANPWATPEIDPDEQRVVARVADLQDAVGRVAAAAVGDAARREALLDRFDRELDDWATEDEFTEADLDALVLRACRLLDLPDDLARRWRTLPPLRYDLDAADDTPPDPAAPRLPWLRSD